LFLDLRDHYGMVQVVLKDETMLEGVCRETVIMVEGEVIKRAEADYNEKLKSGKVELKAEKVTILGKSKNILPFEIADSKSVNEDTRLKYRYLDLRRNRLQEIMKLRHKITLATRNFLDSEGFLEIETPILCKSTPEGARDYLVPSRVNDGKFYALPQSPQLFKQLLMVGVMEKYFQIAKCFRDEDLRADRQPEFTQIDLEMSFVEENDVMDLAERLVASVFKETKGIEVPLPLKRMRYIDAINLYGSDKPDLRFGMPIEEISDIFEKTEISFLKSVL